METQPIRTLISLDNGTDEMAVRAALPQDETIQLVGLIRGAKESWSTLQESPTDLLLIACSGYSERVLSFIGAAAREHPRLPVVVLVQSSPEGFLTRLFEAGADDVIRLPEAPERVRFVIQKVVARRRAATGASDTAHAPMICVLGPKGGVGKTVTVANMAVALAQLGKRVAVVDLDVQFGDLALCLGVRPDTTIYDLVSSPGSLDAEKLEAYLMTHEESGVRVLVAPTRPDQAGRITVEFLREVYAILRETHDFVVVDCAPGFTPEVIAAIDSSTHVLILSMLDTLSLKNARLGLETLELMGYDQNGIKFVLNRANSRVGITDEDAMAIAGRQPDFRIPSDVEITRSVNEGRPIVISRPKSEAAEAYMHLAEEFAGPAPEEAPKEETVSQPRRRLLPRRT